MCTDHPGPRAGAQFQESPDVEQPPRGSVCPAAVLWIPGRLPVLLRHAGSAEHTHAHTPVRSGAHAPSPVRFRLVSFKLGGVCCGRVSSAHTNTCACKPRPVAGFEAGAVGAGETLPSSTVSVLHPHSDTCRRTCTNQHGLPELKV